MFLLFGCVVSWMYVCVGDLYVRVWYVWVWMYEVRGKRESFIFTFKGEGMGLFVLLVFEALSIGDRSVCVFMRLTLEWSNVLGV